jgi:hypothetical protein
MLVGWHCNRRVRIDHLIELKSEVVVSNDQLITWTKLAMANHAGVVDKDTVAAAGILHPEGCIVEDQPGMVPGDIGIGDDHFTVLIATQIQPIGTHRIPPTLQGALGGYKYRLPIHELPSGVVYTTDFYTQPTEPTTPGAQVASLTLDPGA